MKHETDADSGSATAAEWFVAIDSGPVDPETDRAFAAWLDGDAEHERALERCESAVRAAAELEHDPELSWAFAELASPEKIAAAHSTRSDSAGWLTKPGFAWATATAAGLLVALLLLAPHIARQPSESTLPTQDATPTNTRVPQEPDSAELPPRGELLGDTLRRAAPLESTVTIPYSPLPNSIAVLPFESLGPEPDSRNLAAALHEEILTTLARVGDLNVISRTAVLPYAGATESIADIAHDLNVATVMEGSVSYVSNGAVVTVQLIDASTGMRLWSESYDRQFGNILEVEAEIAQSVAAATGAAIAAVENSAGGADVMGVPPRRLVWVDQSGREETLPYPALPFTSLRLSPDGRRIAATVERETSELWALDVARGTATRLSFDSEPARAPVWTPDGRAIVFGVDAEGLRGGLYQVAADGVATPRAAPLAVPLPGEGPTPLAVLPDGATVVYSVTNRGNVDIGMVLAASGAVVPLIASTFDESQAAISPDGRWIAYTSDETGQSEVYVRTFPDLDRGRWQISTDGGSEPVWGRDGRQLYYRRNGWVAAVDVETSPNFSVGWSSPALFGRYASTPDGASYDIAPDGERFLMLRDVRGTADDAGSRETGRLRSTGYTQ